MRINFLKVNQDNLSQRYQIVNDFDLANFFFINYNIDLVDYQINWLDTFSDQSRYLLNVYNISLLNDFKQVEIINFELKLNFDLRFDFKLFAKDYVNYWKNDDIDYIKPLVYSYNNLNLATLAFNYLVASFFRRIYQLLDNQVFFCKKINDVILLSFINCGYEQEKIEFILDNFIDAIYEMVKATSARYGYDIPSSTGLIEVNMQDWYDYQTKKNKKRRFKTKKQ